MFCLDVSAEEPALNLALDEALLEEAEAGHLGQVLRLWESPTYFAVVGLTQAVDEVVFRDRCEADEIPILRRCSAGGCVLQGPGCLNYSLVLEIEREPALRTIRESYRWILGRIAGALTRGALRAVPDGISDITADGLKFSGNAQRRKKRHILHHGTILYDFKMNRISTYLKEPAIRPDYRAERTHAEFLTNIEMAVSALRSGLLGCFSIAETLDETPAAVVTRAQKLQREQYSCAAWNYKNGPNSGI